MVERNCNCMGLQNPDDAETKTFFFPDLELEYILDARKEKQKRLYFLRQEGATERKESITLRKSSDRSSTANVWKKSFTVYLKEGSIHDKLTTLDIQVRSKKITEEIESRNFEPPDDEP